MNNEAETWELGSFPNKIFKQKIKIRIIDISCKFYLTK